MIPAQEYLTTSQVAEKLQVHVQSVRRWIRLKNLKAIKLGNKYLRVSSDDLENFLNNQEGTVK